MGCLLLQSEMDQQEEIIDNFVNICNTLKIKITHNILKFFI